MEAFTRAACATRDLECRLLLHVRKWQESVGRVCPKAGNAMQLRRDRHSCEGLDIREEGRLPDWYTQGLYDGQKGWNRHRPRMASLQVSRVSRKRIRIWSKVRRYEKHLERLNRPGYTGDSVV